MPRGSKKSNADKYELGTTNQKLRNGFVDYQRFTKNRAAKNREKSEKSRVSNS
jgi:hypothetical protein